MRALVAAMPFVSIGPRRTTAFSGANGTVAAGVGAGVDAGGGLGDAAGTALGDAAGAALGDAAGALGAAGSGGGGSSGTADADGPFGGAAPTCDAPGEGFPFFPLEAWGDGAIATGALFGGA